VSQYLDEDSMHRAINFFYGYERGLISLSRTACRIFGIGEILLIFGHEGTDVRYDVF
jgi:hypothetical protein